MEKCINCSKEYTIRGLRLHRNKCDKIYILLKETENLKKEKEANKVKIEFSHINNLSLANYLPDDCVKIIYDFLLLKDNNISFYKLYEYINNISFVCKNFYINRPDINYIRDKIKLELDEKICRSWSIVIYGLTNDELNDLDYKIVSRRYGMTVHLFDIIEIQNLAYKKYGTEYDYKKYLANKKYMKSLTKKEKDIIYKNRKIIYDNLFNKYNYKNNCFLEKVYEYNLKDYVKKYIPRLSTVEDTIIDNIDKIILKNNLIDAINKLNIEYFETVEVSCYIHKIKNYDIDKAISSLKKRVQKEIQYNQYLENNNCNKDEYNLLAYIFINNSSKNINSLFLKINNCELIKKYIDKDFCIKDIYNEIIIDNFINNSIDIWCNNNRNNSVEDFEFIKYFDNSIQIIIKKKFNIFWQEENIILNKQIERDNIINRYKTKNKFNNDLFCFCDNLASIKCTDFLCKTCCKNTSCNKHYKNI